MSNHQENAGKILKWQDADTLTGEHIVIPDGYTEINESAFQDRDEIKSVTIPDSVTAIGAQAFYRCTSLTGIRIPASVTSIGKYAFSDCGSMAHIDVDPSNPNYSSENGVLFNKDKSILIKYPVGKLEKTYEIPGSVTKIAFNAFPFSKLEEIIIPNGVTQIGRYAFNECRSLTKLTLPDSVTNVGKSAFSNCAALKEITLSGGLTAIPESMFCNSTSLTEITISESVTKISAYAFNGCDSLENILVCENNQHFSSEGGVLFNKDRTSLIKIPAKKTGFYTIPDSVTEIERNAIEDCDLLTGIAFPASVAEIEVGHFIHCMEHCIGFIQ